MFFTKFSVRKSNQNQEQPSIKREFGIGKAYKKGKKKLKEICATIVFGLLAAPAGKMEVE